MDNVPSVEIGEHKSTPRIPTMTDRIFTGESGTNDFADPANWSGGISPVPNKLDELINKVRETSAIPQVANFRDRPGEQKVTISFGGISVQLGVTEFRSMLSEVVISSIDDRELKRVARDMLELVNTLISISPVTDEDMQQMLANRAETGHAYKSETHKLEALAELWRLKFKDMHFTTGTDFQEIIERWKSNLTSVAD